MVPRPGGRHAFSMDFGSTWSYSGFDAYNGTIEWAPDSTGDTGINVSKRGVGGRDGSVELVYLRARPHLVIDPASGHITHLSNGVRPIKSSDHVYTLVVPVGRDP